MKKTIVHLSDLHFGTQDQKIVAALNHAITRLAPDLAIISGDFTQIGSQDEFKLAHDFLNNLPCHSLCVPGNHDIPARNLIQRFFIPYQRYRQYIGEELCPVYENDHIIVAGLNSARRALPHWNWANGAISYAQQEYLKSIFHPDDPRYKICTFHHPIHKMDDTPLNVTVFGGKATLNVIQELRIDLVLTGHVHHAALTTRGDHNHQTVYLSASTALSSRTREQENGFNLITLEVDSAKIDLLSLQNNETFEVIKTFEIRKSSSTPSPEPALP